MSDVVGHRARERLTHVVVVASLCFSTFYIIWRWGWTLNTDALWYSVPLALAETYGLVTAFFLAVTAWTLTHRESPPPLRGRSVDVFVTVYDEPLPIIRKTVLAARSITYPHLTYILDDGRRDDVRALAHDLAVRYVRRETNVNAKAGNLNNALRLTDGEFILQLDADHVPLPQIIDRLIGFFADNSIAFVQSPQDFYNTDAFTYDVDRRTRRLWEDQQLFFRVLQAGKDRFNAAFFVGSCALLRRSALEGIGGFATNSVTEDIETSLLLHARGWRSVYLNETLAYGLAPVNARAFHVQHLRWGQGAMQVLRKYRPLRMLGLTVHQRIAYLDSLTTYLGGFQKLIFYLAPIVFFVTGEFPLSIDATTFAAIFLPYIVLQFASFKLLARGHASFLLVDRYAMAKFATHIRAITGFIVGRRLRFRVTPKRPASAPLVAYAPQLLLVVVTLAALGWAVFERLHGFEDEIPGWGSSAFLVNVTFALWNAGVAVQVVRMSLRGKQRRAEHRFAEALEVTVRALPEDRVLAAHAIVENLNSRGASLLSTQAIDDGAYVAMTLPLKPRAVTASGIVVRRHESITPYGKAHVYGVLFGDLDRAARDAIDMHCAQHAVPLEGQRYRPGVVSFARRYVLNRSRERGAIPARVVVSDGGHMRDLGVVLVEATGRRDVRLTVESPIVETSIVELHTAGSPTALTGRVGSVQALETSLGTRFLADVTTQTMGARKMHASLRLYEAIRRHVAAYQQIVYAKVSHGATATAAALQDLRVLYRSPSDTGDVMNIRSTAAPPDTRAALTPALNGPPTPSAPTLLAVYGGSAKLEGKFDVQESIEIQCEITGELHVGGTLIIGERGRVTADVSTANAVINGSYSGNLKATGAVEIAATGRVGGKIESAELVIAKGAIFTGTVTHIERSTQDSVALAPSAQERLPDAERPIPVSKLVELNVSGVHQAQPTSRATLGGVS